MTAKRENLKHCGAKTRQGGRPCRKPAGWGTKHVGEGRCRLHGGNGGRPPTHGRYSKIKREELRDLIEAYQADPDPLNLEPELAACRALFQDLIERTDGRPDVTDAHRLLSEITKIVKRIEDIRAQNHVTRPDLIRIMQEMGRVVDRYVADQQALELIRDGWLAIRV